MKKILLQIFLLVGILSFLPTSTSHAQIAQKRLPTLICETGCGKQEMLQEEGYLLSKGRVDFATSGTYEIEYQKESSFQLLKRTVVVKSHSELLEKGYEDFSMFSLGEDSMASTISKICFLSNGDYVFIKTFSKEVENQVLSTIHMVCMRKDRIIYDRTLATDELSYVSSIQDDPNLEQIVFTKIIYQENTDYDIDFEIYDYAGLKKETKLIQGSKDDIVNDIAVTTTNYYLVGKTKSNDLDFLHLERKDQTSFDSFLVELDKTTLYENSCKDYGETNDDDIESIQLANHNFYFIKKFFNHVGASPKLSYEILVLDETGEKKQSMVYSATSGFEIEKSFFDEQYFYFIGGIPSKKTYCLYRLDQLGKVTTARKYEFTDPYFDSISFKDAYLQEGLFCVLFETYHSETLETGFYFEQSSDEKIFTQIQKPYHAIQLVPNESIGFLIQEDNALYLGKEVNINILSEGTKQITSNNDDPLDYEIVINNELVRHDTKRSETMVDKNMFGTYSLYLDFCTSTLELYFRKEVYVLPNLSIEDGKTYDEGIRLTFLGHGFLDGVPIDSGTICNNCGEHVLQVTGKNDERCFSTFHVKNLSYQKEVTNIPAISSSAVTWSSTPEKVAITTELDDSIVQPKSYYWWSLSIPFITSSLCFLMMIRRKNVQ